MQTTTFKLAIHLWRRLMLLILELLVLLLDPTNIQLSRSYCEITPKAEQSGDEFRVADSRVKSGVRANTV